MRAYYLYIIYRFYARILYIYAFFSKLHHYQHTLISFHLSNTFVHIFGSERHVVPCRLSSQSPLSFGSERHVVPCRLSSQSPALAHNTMKNTSLLLLLGNAKRSGVWGKAPKDRKRSFRSFRFRTIGTGVIGAKPLIARYR